MVTRAPSSPPPLLPSFERLAFPTGRAASFPPQHALASKRLGGVGAEPPSGPQSRSSLDQLQTSSQPPSGALEDAYPDYDVNPDYIPFEHRGWHNTRMRVFAAMKEVGVAPARVCKFLGCGEEVHVYEEAATGEIAWRGTRCNDRFCIVCGQIRSFRISRALEPMVRAEAAMFITLTVRGKPGDSLQSLITKLTEGWKGLRRLKYWNERIRGGAIMLEVKYSLTSGGHWHPHFHLLCHGKWLDQQWLRDAWNVLTRDSDQCDVQRVVEVEKALGYVVKYASKPMDASFTQRPHLLREAMRTLKGKRLCACFGSWYGTPLHEEDLEADDETRVLTQWRYCGTRRVLECRASGGDAAAKIILARLVRAQALRLTLDKRCRSSPPNGPAPPDNGDLQLDILGSGLFGTSGVPSPDSDASRLTA